MEVGQQLFQARQRRGLTLDDISQTTKIPVSLLQAIERDDASRLPQGFFTRAFVRAYANEVGVNADALLDNADLGKAEEVAGAPVTHVPIEEPSSPKSVFFAFALGAACTMFYSGFASPAAPPIPPPVAAASVMAHAEPAAFAPSPCEVPPATPIQSVQRSAGAVPSQAAPSEKVELAAQPISVTHVVTENTVEPSAASIDSPPVVTDAILPTPDAASSPAPVDQF